MVYRKMEIYRCLTNSFWNVVPQNQSLIYAFDTTGEQRTNQDVGYDGYSDDR